MKYYFKIRLIHHIIWLVALVAVIFMWLYTKSNISYMCWGMLLPIPIYFELWVKNNKRIHDIMTTLVIQAAKNDKDINNLIDKHNKRKIEKRKK